MRGVAKKTFVEPKVPWFRGFVGFREIKKNSSVFEFVIFREGSLSGKEVFFSIIVCPKEGYCIKKKMDVKKRLPLLVPHHHRKGKGFFFWRLFSFLLQGAAKHRARYLRADF